MTSESGKRYCGSVKWYNYKHQYGFITYINDEGDSEDIFVHSKDLISNKKNKYLNKGEYVEFELVSYTNINDDDKGNHEDREDPDEDVNEEKIKAGNVTGINKTGLQMEHLNVVHQNTNSSYNSNQNRDNGGWQTVGRRH
jgi:cold shock CspA family protein